MTLQRLFLTNAILNTISLKNDIILNSTWKPQPFSQMPDFTLNHLLAYRLLHA